MYRDAVSGRLVTVVRRDELGDGVTVRAEDGSEWHTCWCSLLAV